MFAFIKLLSPSMWTIISLTVALGVQTARVQWAKAETATAVAEVATLKGQITLQNLNIEAFRMEAALMGLSLKKHKKIAADLRSASKKKVRDILKQPVVAECNKAVVSSTQAAQTRLKEALGAE